MDGDEFSEFLIPKTGGNDSTSGGEDINDEEETNVTITGVCNLKREPLTTKKAVKFLLEGTLKYKVCRYCMNVDSPLYEMDQVFQIASQGALYKVTIRDMVASFYPFQVLADPNFPTKICNQCLENTIQSYLFTQQCERSGRALRNCFEDMYEKLDKLDPLERTKKRGRQKLNPNYNKLHSEHENVIDYADPVINIVNIGSELTENIDNKINELECPKCWLRFESLESRLYHEKIHPKSMWFNCRICGKSFAKRHVYRKHVKSAHEPSKSKTLIDTDYKCSECDVGSETYDQHLQHIEKHKFHMVMEHLIESKMDELCTVCLSKGVSMVKLDRTINFHGGCPELTGHRSLYTILGSTMPEMNILSTYTGSKICKKCLDNAITSYVFLNHAHYVRNRLKTCVELMLDSLGNVGEPDGKIFVEISQNIILPAKEPDLIDESLLVDPDEVDESKLNVEVLEDEFRTKDSESESDIETTSRKVTEKTNSVFHDTAEEIEQLANNPARHITKTYGKGINGLQSRLKSKSSYNSISNVCREFLTFKKERKPKRVDWSKISCPMCNKRFISIYFLKSHIVRHVFKNVKCKICQKQFKSKFHLHEHTKMVHLLGNINHSSCETCGRTFVSAKNLIKHVKTHNTKECLLCDKFFAKQKQFDNHWQRHTAKLRLLQEKKIQTCSFCEKPCANNNNLTVHVNKVHLQIKPYSCDMCESQFYTDTNLNHHKKVHSMFSREKCNFCNKSLKSRKALVIHVRKHIGAMPYTCILCSQNFYSQGKLRNHMKIFHGGKFCCKPCKSVFANKYELKLHLNIAHNNI
ncbi:putative zinc finger protein 840 isoform X1 [Amyelois transitella]|uniref:putative zinc finger protein 840 isoform X1 n=1 Tax=Amyelois transitella TaxID=680683 RepID=UPI00067BC270|nr:putative zinc finger protein 840 isoform X1 [Amyelois transitella]